MGERKPTVDKTMIDQFNDLTEARKKARENNPRGPVDIKSLRREITEKNLKNRKP